MSYSLQTSKRQLPFPGNEFTQIIFFSVVCAVVSHPPDTIVSYMNKAKGSTFTSSAKALGLRGLWGGLVARTIMIGTLTAMQWFIYDFVKVIVTFRFVTLFITKNSCCLTFQK